MIGRIEFPPAVELIDIGLEVIEQIALALAGKVQRSGGVGWP
jgi:hypothetical protein